jgi:hypothetical protein
MKVMDGKFEYMLLEAGSWELGRLHSELALLRRCGWQLDEAFDGEHGYAAGDESLHIWLKRRRTAVAAA